MILKNNLFEDSILYIRLKYESKEEKIGNYNNIICYFVICHTFIKYFH